MRSGDGASRADRTQGGFGYLLLLVLIAVLGVTAATTVQVGQSITRRHAEEALLAAGDDFRAAIASYRSGGQGGPRELSDLLRDPRQSGVRRHLRRVPADPLTGQAEWGVVRDGPGRIIGVYSLAPGRPIKRDGFGSTQSGFADAESYNQWQFGFVPARPASAAAAAAR